MSGASVPAQQAVKAALAGVLPNAVFPVIAPDSTPANYCVYQMVASAPENTLNNGVALENDRYQVDIYAPDYITAHDLADAARAALVAIGSPFAVVFLMQADHFEADIRLHRVVQEYSIWQPRRL